MFKLDMKAIRQSAYDSWLMANVANVANVANEANEANEANLANEMAKNGLKISQQLPKLAIFAELATSQQPQCTLQSGRATELRSQPSTQPAEMLKQPSAHKPARQTFMQSADTWHDLDKAYQAHHFNCPTCIAAGKGYGLRCGAGAALYTAYLDESADRSSLD